MTEFKRTCRIFDKFLLALKRRGMGHHLFLDDPGMIKLSFWYEGMDYETDGYLLWQSADIGTPRGIYQIYKTALELLRKDNPIKK